MSTPEKNVLDKLFSGGVPRPPLMPQDATRVNPNIPQVGHSHEGDVLTSRQPSMYEQTVPLHIRQALRSRPDVAGGENNMLQTIAGILGLNDPLSNIEGPAKAATVLSKVDDVAHPLSRSVVSKGYGKNINRNTIKEIEDDIIRTKRDIDVVKTQQQRSQTPEEFNTALGAHEKHLKNMENLIEELTGKDPVNVYHGTGSAFETFDPQKLDPQALYGPGYYFTENPEIASGYTRKYSPPSPALREEISKVTAERQKLINSDNRLRAKQFDIRKEIDPKNPNTAIIPRGHPREAEYEVLRRQVDENQDNYNRLTDKINELEQSASTPNIRPARLAVEKPFDIDKVYKIDELPKELQAYVQPNAFTAKHGVKGSEIYDAIKKGYMPKSREELIQSNLFGGEINSRKIFAREVLEKAGYDGITHIGGARTGNDPHRVWIVFDKNKIFSPFGPANKAKVVGFNEGEDKPVDKLFSPKQSNA